MTRILTVMVVTAALVVFGAQNWDNVPVQLIFGPPTRVRLVFLLLIAVGVGYVTALLRGFGRELRLRNEVRQLRRQLRTVEASREILVAPSAAEGEDLVPVAAERSHERV